MHNLTALSEDTPSSFLVADLLDLVSWRTSLSAQRLSSFRSPQILVENFELSSYHAIHVAEDKYHHVVYAIEVPLVYILLHFLDLA